MPIKGLQALIRSEAAPKEGAEGCRPTFAWARLFIDIAVPQYEIDSV